MVNANSFNTLTDLQVGNENYQIYSLDALSQAGFNVKRLPYSLKILLENLLRTEDGVNIKSSDIQALINWDANTV